ncbi:hypothetical protein LXL04_011338 [Taraxacum kok-saghyz]
MQELQVIVWLNGKGPDFPMGGHGFESFSRHDASREKVGSSLGKNQSGEIKEGGKGGDSRLPGKSGPVSNVPERLRSVDVDDDNDIDIGIPSHKPREVRKMYEFDGHSDQMWTSSERFYPNVDKFGTFLPKCGQDGSGYSKPLPLLFPVVVGNIAGDAPPPLILRLFLSFRLHEFEREIGGGSRARAGLRPKKKGRLVTHRRFPSQTHAAASSETAAVSKVAARLRRCSHPLPEKEEVAVSNIQSRLVHIWVKTFRTCSHLGKNVPNLSTFGPSHLLKPLRYKRYFQSIDREGVIDRGFKWGPTLIRLVEGSGFNIPNGDHQSWISRRYSLEKS